MVRSAQETTAFEAERPRLVGLATRVLGDAAEAEDIVQQAWLRLDRSDTEIDSLPAWLTTVTTRLCLDRLRAHTPTPVADEHLESQDAGRAGTSVPTAAAAADPAHGVKLAETVGVALQVVLDQLTPSERVAFVLHDTFGFEFATIATMLDTSPAAARKLASRARTKVRAARPRDQLADWEVVDAFLAAARGADFGRLLELLAPDAVIGADPAAVLAGTPERIEGREAVATFFNGAAAAALPVFVADRAGAAWFHRGAARVAFDFAITDGMVTRIDFRADADVLASVRRRQDGGHA